MRGKEGKRLQQSTQAKSGKQTQSNARAIQCETQAPIANTSAAIDDKQHRQSRQTRGVEQGTYARSSSSGSGSPVTAPAARRTSATTQITGDHRPRPIRPALTANQPPAPPDLRLASENNGLEHVNAASANGRRAAATAAGRRLRAGRRDKARDPVAGAPRARGAGIWGRLGFWRARGFVVASERGNEWNGNQSRAETMRRGRKGWKISGSDARGASVFKRALFI